MRRLSPPGDQLNERRGVAEQLNIALGGKPQQAQARPLDPGADDADDDAQHQAKAHQPDRRQKSIKVTRAIERVIEDRELDSGRLMQQTEPIPKWLKAPHSPKPVL